MSISGSISEGSDVRKALTLASTSLMLLALTRCNPISDLKGFDSSAWKQDKKGCLGIRKVFEESLWRQREKLVDMDEGQIIEVLGRPNYTELYIRNQKFFVYYISASADCEKGSGSPRSLVIRFDALNYSNEISRRN